MHTATETAGYDERRSAADLDALLGQILTIETRIAAHKNAIEAIGDDERAKTKAEELYGEIVKLEANRTYYEYSIAMDYGLKKAFAQESGDERRKQLVRDIKARNPFYWKP